MKHFIHKRTIGDVELFLIMYKEDDGSESIFSVAFKSRHTAISLRTGLDQARRVGKRVAEYIPRSRETLLNLHAKQIDNNKYKLSVVASTNNQTASRTRAELFPHSVIQ